ncbi:FAD/NAD(P)-binding domain-protein [Diplogelasinospora grovesii]|uniref:FAD/NAD(P)-binding domain-protein n=1 Tax=Diplogelasinospora grovesii TaxID=303347 RepID=A0AAN6MWE4_9PEZI|nr:FAD/NAD(P)-binding domain-protein [Diplogelasinospora grovesii]
MPSQPRITIVGAGPSGLTLAVLLHRRSIPFTVYELRSRPTPEELSKPSGMLDLHEESGLAAIRACGLFDEFSPLTSECAESMKIADRTGNVLYEDEGQQEGRPEISRHNLTKLLLSHLPEESIKWNHKLISATPSTTTEITLQFTTNGHTMEVTADLVIGADGAWSRTRKHLLTPIQPAYTGVQWITCTIVGITAKYPHLSDLVGPGSFCALGACNGVMTQRGVQDSCRVYLAISTDDEHWGATAGFSGNTAAQIKDTLLSDDTYYGTWGDTMKEMIEVSCDEETAQSTAARADKKGGDGEVDIKPLYMLPIGHTWDHKPGVTAIGDAAHLMTPFAGEGVNMAMWDALSLYEAIASACDKGEQFMETLDPLLREFEKTMAERAGDRAKKSWKNKNMMMGETGAEDMANMFIGFQQMMAQGPPQ